MIAFNDSIIGSLSLFFLGILSLNLLCYACHNLVLYWTRNVRLLNFNLESKISITNLATFGDCLVFFFFGGGWGRESVPNHSQMHFFKGEHIFHWIGASNVFSWCLIHLRLIIFTMIRYNNKSVTFKKKRIKFKFWRS